MHNFTDEDLWNCATREAAYRQRVYRRLVDSGKMTQDEALRQIEMMRAIAQHFADRAGIHPATADGQQEDLF